MGLQSQAKFLRGPSPQPLQVLRAGQVRNKTESHLQHCAIPTCLLAKSCSISGGQDPQRTTGDGWGNAKCTPTYILKSISCNQGASRTLRKMATPGTTLIVTIQQGTATSLAITYPATQRSPYSNSHTGLNKKPFHALKQDNCEEDVPSAPPWLPPPLPASVPCPPAPALCPSRFLKATPTWLVFKAAPTPTPQQPLLPPLPRVSPPPSAGPQHIPVAHRTRACLAAPQLSSLVELVQYHVPTAKTTRCRQPCQITLPAYEKPSHTPNRK
jgi:hypothetical protein